MCGVLTTNTSKMKILKAIEILTQLQNKGKKQPCKHERGEFQYYLAQGIKYFKCKKCGEVYED